MKNLFKRKLRKINISSFVTTLSKIEIKNVMGGALTRETKARGGE